MKPLLRYILIAIGILICSFFLQRLPISKPLLKITDLRIYDTIVDFANAFGNPETGTTYDEICIIDINEKSIAALGQYSKWQNFFFADLVDILAADEPLAIGFDMFFTESDSIFGYSRSRLMENIGGNPDQAKRLLDNLSSDNAFAASLKKAGNVFLAMLDSRDTSIRKQLPPKLRTWDVKNVSYVPITNPHPPIPILSEAAAGIGFANIIADESGVIHDFPLFNGYQDKYYANFSFQMCLDLMNIDQIEVDRTCKLYSQSKLITEIPLSPEGSCYLKYYGPQQSFRYISFSDVLQNRIYPGYFKDRIVLIGSSASGLRDIKSTPLDPSYPGVELHATFIRNVLEEAHIHWLNEKLILLVASIMLLLQILFIRKAKPLLSITVFSAITILFFIVFYFLYARADYTMSYSAFLLPWIMGFTAIFSAQFHDQSMEKRKVRNAFEHYVSKELIQQIMKGSHSLKPGGDKKRISILFADVRNFTSYCEKLNPAEITGFMNRYFNQATELIFTNHGLLDKYIGDALLALFGAPLPLESFASHAVKTALELRDLSQQLRQANAQHPVLHDFTIGIGVATGEVIVGNIGSDSIFNYTGIGDRMNFCARLESLNKYYKSSIIIDSETYEMIKDGFLCRKLDRVTVKGKQLVSDIYEVLDYSLSPSTDAISIQGYSCYETALALMASHHYEEAEKHFNEALRLIPNDYPTIIMLERLKTIDKHAWDGIWQHENK
jgi:adenylate cyclase